MNFHRSVPWNNCRTIVKIHTLRRRRFRHFWLMHSHIQLWLKHELFVRCQWNNVNFAVAISQRGETHPADNLYVFYVELNPWQIYPVYFRLIIIFERFLFITSLPAHLLSAAWFYFLAVNFKTSSLSSPEVPHIT